MHPIRDFPKIQCPFIRKTVGDRYLVTPYILPGYEWVFNDPGVKAVDKLHGSNFCVIIQNKKIVAVDNRTTRVLESGEINGNIGKLGYRALQGIINSCEKGWFSLEKDGRFYGELVGPQMNGNLHQTDMWYFVPFDYLANKCHWKSWIENKYPKDYHSISDWFLELPSLFTKNRMKKEGLAEGLIFLHPDGRLAKLRRNMFLWFEGDPNA